MHSADQDHIGWKSWKLIARSISPTPSLFVAQRPSPIPRRTWVNLGRLEVGWGKSGVLEHKRGNISEMRKYKEKLLWRAYRKSETLFRTVPSPTLYGAPRLEVRNPTPKLQSLLSQERLKLRTAYLADTFTGSIRTKAH